MTAALVTLVALVLAMLATGVAYGVRLRRNARRYRAEDMAARIAWHAAQSGPVVNRATYGYVSGW